MADTELQCYHKGCGKKYNPAENKGGSCMYHPGAPVFHDAMKGWSCCNKKSTDFSEFLNILGCTTGQHSNERPAPEVKPIVEECEIKDKPIIISAPPPNPIPEHKRPSADDEKVPLNLTVGATLKTALQKREAAKQAEGDKTEHADSADGSMPIGTACKNNGCGVRYQNEADLSGTCLHHPGAPVFHEGMKFWSCCQRKTSEFDKFMDQIGCEQTCHKWMTTKEDKQKQVACRVDWHQTGSSVVISVFAKCSDPEKTVIKVNKVSVDIHIIFEDDKMYENKTLLYGEINVMKSNVKLLGAKVEIILKKADPINWPTLEYKPKTAEQTTENEDLS